MRKKLLMILSSALLTLVLFSLPIFAVGSVVAVPVQAISELFESIDNFMFGEGVTDADDLVLLIQMSISNQENQTKIKTTYSGKLNKNDADVPEHYAVVIQFLSGIEFEEMTDEYIEKIVNAAIVEIYDSDKNESVFELATLDNYADNIKKISPFSNKLSKIPSSDLAEIIRRVGTIDSGSSLSPELIEKYKGKLMYPFQKVYPVGESIGTYYPNGKPEVHNGLDIKAPCGVPVYAMDDGTVDFVESNNYWRGNYIIWTNGNMEYRYFHFRDPLTLSSGSKVSKGQYIGSVGNTGYSFGCHLHLEIRIDGEIVEPLDLLEVSNPFFE